MIICNLRNEYIQEISLGRKTFEGRINKNSFSGYQPGTIVKWVSKDSEVITKIISRHTFNSFREMLHTIGYKYFIPKAKTLEEAKQIYDSIPDYKELVKIYGALALELKLL